MCLSIPFSSFCIKSHFLATNCRSYSNWPSNELRFCAVHMVLFVLDDECGCFNSYCMLCILGVCNQQTVIICLDAVMECVYTFFFEHE